MSDLLASNCGVVKSKAEAESHASSINLGNSLEVETLREGGWLLSESHLSNVPLAGRRILDNEKWSAVFSGDLIGRDEVPFDKMFANLEAGNYEYLASLEGVFAAAAYDKSRRKLYAITDRRGQKPLYYRQATGLLTVSTSVVPFVRSEAEPVFDKHWLWQYFVFNFPIDDTSFLSSVKRIGPACVLIFEERSGCLSFSTYAKPFSPRPHLLRGSKSLEFATNVFRKTMPDYYAGAESVACALTGGWDGRTLLAMAPADKSVTAYTYGGPGCEDLEAAKIAAESVGLDHLTIPFDEEFQAQLPARALETVYLSGGLQGVLRSTLLHAYSTLTSNAKKFPLTISGIAFGTEFRGSAQVPDLISPYMSDRFHGYASKDPLNSWHSVFGTERQLFDDYIQEKVDYLRNRFGPFEDSEHHVAYTVYPASSSYFCGELAIAGQFTTVRVPAWDSRVIDLVYSIEHSTLSFSHFSRHSNKVKRLEMALQAHLLKEFSPELFEIPVRGIHPSSILAGELVYQSERAYRSFKNRIRRRFVANEEPPLENWKAWLFDRNADFVTSLLQSSETKLIHHLDSSWIDQVVVSRDVRLLGKLLTAEIVLRLLASRWHRFW